MQFCLCVIFISFNYYILNNVFATAIGLFCVFYLFIFLFLWILFIWENNLRCIIPCNTVDVIYVIKTIPFYNAGVILPLKFQAEMYI